MRKFVNLICVLSACAVLLVACGKDEPASAMQEQSVSAAASSESGVNSMEADDSQLPAEEAEADSEAAGNIDYSKGGYYLNLSNGDILKLEDGNLIEHFCAEGRYSVEEGNVEQSPYYGMGVEEIKASAEKDGMDCIVMRF